MKGNVKFCWWSDFNDIMNILLTQVFKLYIIKNSGICGFYLTDVFTVFKVPKSLIYLLHLFISGDVLFLYSHKSVYTSHR